MCDAVVDITSDMPSLIVDVPKAVAYLARMLGTLVSRQVVPSAVLPAALARALGVPVSAEAAAAEAEEEVDDYYDDDVEDPDELEYSLGVASKNTKAKHKHSKKDAVL